MEKTGEVNNEKCNNYKNESITMIKMTLQQGKAMIKKFKRCKKEVQFWCC